LLHYNYYIRILGRWVLPLGLASGIPAGGREKKCLCKCCTNQIM
jgi:hypothetical protein